MNEPLVTFREVVLGYGTRPVLSGLSLRVCRGDFLGIVGPNGSGKTTILRALLGLIRPRAGEIVFGADGLRGGVHLGYVPQHTTVDEVFPLSVFDVVLMGRTRRLGAFRRPGAADRDAARRALAASGIAEHADRAFHDLSGGQKQRTLIARALATEPDLLVLDEPTSGMDLAGETSVMMLIDELHRRERLTVVMVSHQLNTVAKWCRRLGILHEGILETGSVEEILTSETLARIYGAGAGVARIGDEMVILPPKEPR